MRFVSDLLAFLDSRGVPAAVIGGAALAVHGVARATVDVDLLTTAPRVLDPAFWRGFAAGAPPEIRRGDAEDPVGGLCRWTATDPPVDLVVGKGDWMDAVVARRRFLDWEGARLPVVGASDLILLKLAAGGPQDRLDIRLLLARDDGTLRREVEEQLPSLPREPQTLWASLGDM